MARIKGISKWKVMCITAAFFVMLPLHSLFAADSNILISINGVALQTEVAPLIQNDRTFVPVRAIGEALGYTVDFDESAGAITMTQDTLGVLIEMTLGSGLAYVNGEPYALDAVPMIIEGRTMVPVRFISEAMDSRVQWRQSWDDNGQPVPSKVAIYTSYPITLQSGQATVSSFHAESSVQLDEDHAVSYALTIPQFDGTEDEVFAIYLNNAYQQYLMSAKQFIEALGIQEDGYFYSASDESDYSIPYDQGDILSLYIEGYEYTGGVHGMPYRVAANIDFVKSKVLLLADLFEVGSDYETRLVTAINEQIDERQDIYESVDKVDHLFYNDTFYFEPGTLVVYFYPYDLSSYARGFVSFRIPLGDLADVLLPEYAGL